MCGANQRNFIVVLEGGLRFVSILEFLIAILSVVAACLHYRHTGGYATGKLRGATLVTFNISHATFCIFSAVIHTIYDHVEICTCDPMNISWLVLEGAFTVMLLVFSRFWRKMLSNEKKYRSSIRLLSWGVVFVVMSVFYLTTIFSPSCEEDSGSYWFESHDNAGFTRTLICWYTLYLILVAEYFDLAIICVARMKKIRDSREDSHVGFLELQVLLFVLLPISITVGIIFISIGSLRSETAQNVDHFFYLVPSVLTFTLMWSRHSIQDDDRLDDSDSDAMEWATNRMSNVIRNSRTDFSGPLRASELAALEMPSFLMSNPLEDNAVDARMMSLQKTVSAMRERLVRAPPMSSNIEIVIASEPNESESAQKDSIFAVEYLHASPFAISCPRYFLGTVALPMIERVAAIQLQQLRELRPSTTKSDNSLRNMEFLIISKIASAEESIVDTVMAIRSSRSGFSAAGGGERCERRLKTKTRVSIGNASESSRATQAVENPNEPHEELAVFKPSSEKKEMIFATISTNCQVHTTILRLGSKRRSFQVAEFASITFGAPAAHALGFANGGLRSIKAKVVEGYNCLNKLKLQAEQRRRGSLQNSGVLLDARLDLIALEFEARAREAIVVGQALGAVVVAASELLERFVKEKKVSAIRQIHSIGLLLHSVCLLSTKGSEEAMLDDFAGAYDHLGVVLRLVPPSSENVEDVTESSDVKGVQISLEAIDPLGSAASVLRRGKAHQGGEGVGNTVVTLQIEPYQAYAWILEALQLEKSESRVEIPVVPLLFNLGTFCAFFFSIHDIC